jgi:hypothetical protein
LFLIIHFFFVNKIWKFYRFIKAIKKVFRTYVCCDKLELKSNVELNSAEFSTICKITPDVFKSFVNENIQFNNCINIDINNMRKSEHLMFPKFILSDKTIHHHAKYVTVSILVLDDYNFQILDFDFDFKIKDKRLEKSKLIHGQTYVALVELAIMKSYPQILCYIVAIHPGFLGFSFNVNFGKMLECHLKTLFPRSKNICLVFQSKLNKWKTSQNPIDLLCNQIGSLLLEETKKPEPDFQAIKTCFDQHCPRLDKNIENLNDAEDYLEMQHAHLLKMMSSLSMN